MYIYIYMYVCFDCFDVWQSVSVWTIFSMMMATTMTRACLWLFLPPPPVANSVFLFSLHDLTSDSHDHTYLRVGGRPLTSFFHATLCMSSLHGCTSRQHLSCYVAQVHVFTWLYISQILHATLYIHAYFARSVNHAKVFHATIYRSTNVHDCTSRSNLVGIWNFMELCLAMAMAIQ